MPLEIEMYRDTKEYHPNYGESNGKEHGTSNGHWFTETMKKFQKFVYHFGGPPDEDYIFLGFPHLWKLPLSVFWEFWGCACVRV